MGAIGGWFAAHGAELAITLLGLIFAKQKAGESRKAWLKNVGTGAFHAIEDLAARDLKLKGRDKAAAALALVTKRLSDGTKKPLTPDEQTFLGDLFWNLAHQQKTSQTSENLSR